MHLLLFVTFPHNLPLRSVAALQLRHLRLRLMHLRNRACNIPPSPPNAQRRPRGIRRRRNSTSGSRVTRRSVKSIGNKYLSVKRGWQTVHNLTHQTGAGDGEGSSQFMLQQATWISPKLISVVIKNAIVPITTSGTRYSKVDMAQDLGLGPVLLARTILL
ncbi:hypothetical protein I306_02556 [Cryptococcus gattii EJB2]|uniref:Uncharacterized protein n=1 Tax=Cryptococcus gattii EJB2 TaxID=1296103 RepID=A0ABR5BY63_9TREE|nr:hypothetical protein I306_02556 [Cryptococcus gattii EJB2]